MFHSWSLTLVTFMIFNSVYGQVIHQPTDEFTYRMNMAYKRLTTNTYRPSFTKKFILADVNLEPDNPRRFYNFSGDLSGRYIEVMSLMHQSDNVPFLKDLVKSLIKYQKPDGRFGDSSLVFSEDQIDKQHMALLWGNGRLLLGLLTYYNQYHDQEVLSSAIKSGDFFIKIYDACARPVVVKRLEGFGATGIICLTQYVEGLVLLSKQTGDSKYALKAAELYKLLPERGKQHSHGYLATLRGILMLYHYSNDATQLQFVKNAYDDLINSDDYTIFDSVREYFGRDVVERDEGCSTADFVRLSFGLYAATNDIKYLEKGELALYNALFFNQYYTGDFGHHIITNNGSDPHYLHAAWWCCTMHGLRAMYEVKKDYIISEHDLKNYKIDLYIDNDYADKGLSLSMRRVGDTKYILYYDIKVQHINKPLLLRMPNWALNAVCYLNSKKIMPVITNGYISLNRVIKANDKIRVGFVLKQTLNTSARKQIALSEIKGTAKGVLQYGPYLLGVDDKIDADFTAEPNDNILYVKSIILISRKRPLEINKKSFLSGIYLSANYKHGGYPSSFQTILRPISEMTFDKHGYLLLNMVYSSDKNSTDLQRKNSMQSPWTKN